MRYKLSIILFCMFFLILNLSAGENEFVEVQFDECVDGDTAWFIVDGERVKFRFLAIDTPETVHPTKSVEAFGKNASEYTCNKLTNADKIVVEYDSGSAKTDKYKRNLAWIWVDGNLLQQELIEVGYAKVAYIYGDYAYTLNLCSVQKDAIKNEYGMWADSSLEEEYCSTVDYEGYTEVLALDEINIADNNEELSQESNFILAFVVFLYCLYKVMKKKKLFI